MIYLKSLRIGHLQREKEKQKKKSWLEEVQKKRENRSEQPLDWNNLFIIHMWMREIDIAAYL